MAGFIYCRLSRDEDTERESLNNQRDIIMTHIERVGDTLIDEAADDSYSGMNFERPGIKKIYALAEKRDIDTVYVKDLSRLGRHRLYTLMCIEDLRSMNVRVVSVTENIDSFNENDDLMIGFKGLMNDGYVKDIRRKILTAVRQKQKQKGIIQIPPMGYIKDKNTDEILIVEEPAEIIRKIYKLFLDGYGTTAIAKMLNEQGLKTPAYYQLKLIGKKQGDNRPKVALEHLWTSTMVKRILINRFYCGDVINHKNERSRITKKQVAIPQEEQFVHMNMVPAIIPRETWDRVQELVKAKGSKYVKSASNKPCHRYSGLLKCGDCESTFVAKRRPGKDGEERVEYICNGYHRHSKMICSSHRINESEIDKYINDELLNMKERLASTSQTIDEEVKKWMSQKNNTEKKLKVLYDNIKTYEFEIEEILMERINDKQNREIYDKMVERRREDIEKIRTEITQIENIDKTIKERKKTMQNSAELLEKILKEKKLSHANLTLLIDKIIIYEDKNVLTLDINLKAPFMDSGTEFIKTLTEMPRPIKEQRKRLAG